MQWIHHTSDEGEEQHNEKRTGLTATAVGHRSYILGGYSLSAPVELDQIHDRQRSSWTLLPESEKVFFEHHTTHLVDDKLLVIGGESSEIELDVNPASRIQVYQFCLVEQQLSLLETSGNTPPRVKRHVAEFFEWRREVVVFGGTRLEDRAFSNNLAVLNVDAMEWRKLDAKGRRPPPQSSHMSCASRNRMFIFVNYDDPLLSNLFVLDVRYAAAAWSTLERRGRVPPGIYGGSLVLIGRYVLLFGGILAEKFVTSLYICDLEEQVWYKQRQDSTEDVQYTFSVAGAEPPARARHVGVYDSTKLRYYGGLTFGLRDTHELVVDEELIQQALS